MERSAYSSSQLARSPVTYVGPNFQLVEQLDADQLEPGFKLGKRQRPLLIKGAIKHWPASQRWTWEGLAELRRADGSEVYTDIQIGLAEQGDNRKYVRQAFAPYLRSLAEADRVARAAGRDREGLLTAERHAQLSPSDSFRLDWSFMQTFDINQAYISLWHILDEFPALKKDFAVQSLWRGLRWDWAYTFIGPGNSVTGFHFDYPSNLFCQVTGVKEFLLFPPDQNVHMCPSQKYDWGGKMSHIDITKLDQQPEYAASFARAQGLYARVESGDALFVPRRTWHAVVSLLPSISLAVFGLTPWELVIDGGPSVLLALLHWLRLYGRNDCTCHDIRKPELSAG